MKLNIKIYSEFKYFLNHFFKYLISTRGVLVVILLMIIVLGSLFSLVEGLKLGDAIYFSFITGLGVGYGDITPQTPLGQVISVAIGLNGVILFGIIVGIASLSVKKSVKFYIEEK